MEKMRALSKAQFAQSGFDTRDYHFITEPGTFTAYLELKVWGKRSLECFFTFADDRKIIACTFPEADYLGLADTPIGTECVLTFERTVRSKRNNLCKEDTTIPALQQQLRDCEKGIENILNAIQMGILTVSTKERLEQLEQQRETLKTSILQAQIARPQYSKEQIVQWISRFKYGNINDKAYQREIIDVFVNSVYVYDDKLVLTYNFKDGTQTITLKEIEDALSSDMTCVAPPV